MKCGPLKTAIRQRQGNIEVYSSRLETWFAVQKGSFISALESKFPNNGDETNLKLDDNNRIQSD